jgi:prepilin-type processing-associated H-X9-DG protein
MSLILDLRKVANLGFVDWHVFWSWSIDRGMLASGEMDRARVVQSRSRVVYWGSRLVSRWGRSRSMVRSRVMVWVDCCTLIGYLSYVPTMVVCVVVHYLGTAIG